MMCFFCQSDITKYRATGCSKPAGTFQCLHCPQLHGLSKVAMSINVKLEPLEAVIWIDHTYWFRIDFHSNRTYLFGPKEKRTDGTLLTMEGTSVTPRSAKNKMKTYLMFL